MSILNRLSTIFQAEAQSIIEGISSPSKELDLGYSKMQDQLTQAQASLTEVVASRIGLDNQLKAAQAKADKAKANAQEALTQNRDDLARQFLQQKQQADASVAAAQQAVAQLADKEAALTQTVQGLKQRIAEFAAQKEVVQAQLTASKATLDVNKSMTGLSGSLGDASQAMQRAQARVSSQENQAAAIQQLEYSPLHGYLQRYRNLACGQIR
jgi:phage shock protein A